MSATKTPDLGTVDKQFRDRVAAALAALVGQDYARATVEDRIYLQDEAAALMLGFGAHGLAIVDAGDLVILAGSVQRERIERCAGGADCGAVVVGGASGEAPWCASPDDSRPHPGGDVAAERADG